MGACSCHANNRVPCDGPLGPPRWSSFQAVKVFCTAVRTTRKAAPFSLYVRIRNGCLAGSTAETGQTTRRILPLMTGSRPGHSLAHVLVAGQDGKTDKDDLMRANGRVPPAAQNGVSRAWGAWFAPRRCRSCRLGARLCGIAEQPRRFDLFCGRPIRFRRRLIPVLKDFLSIGIES